MRWKRGWILLVPLAIAVVLVFETKTTESPREQKRTLRWSADPKSPGGNLPVQDRSPFDHLIGDESVPFPFSALVEKIARHSPNPKIALVPLGRSLQRKASAPDFFAFPRFIVAADTYPAAAGITLKGPALSRG